MNPSKLNNKDLEGFELLKVIGKGSYGRVFLARRKKNGALCVIKQIQLEGLSEQETMETLNEINLMNLIHHPNVIRYEEAFVEDICLNIVMEYAAGGDLAQKIRAHTELFSEEILWKYLIQLCQGLKCIHDHRIIHRDIKPQNVFLDADNNIKIGDFGLGKGLSSQSNFAHTGVGTPLYISPEIVEERPYDTKSDVWALGCLMYELASKRPPFMATNQVALARKITNEKPQPLPSIYSTEIQFLIFKMLEKDAVKRPDIQQIMNYSAVRQRMEQPDSQNKEKIWRQFIGDFATMMNKKFGEMEQKLSQQQDRINRLANVQQQLLTLKTKNGELQQRCSQLEKSITQKETTISMLNTQIKQLHQERGMAYQQMIEEAQYILQLKKDLEKKEQDLLQRESLLQHNQIALYPPPTETVSVIPDIDTDTFPSTPSSAASTQLESSSLWLLPNSSPERPVSPFEGATDSQLSGFPVQYYTPSKEYDAGYQLSPRGSQDFVKKKTSSILPIIDLDEDNAAVEFLDPHQDEESAQHATALYVWRRLGVSSEHWDMGSTKIHASKVWDNKERVMLDTKAKKFVLFFKINPNLRSEPNVKAFRVRFQYDNQFTKINVKPVELVSNPTFQEKRYYFEVAEPQNKEVLEIILEFDSTNPVDEVVILRHDKKLLEWLKTATYSSIVVQGASRASPGKIHTPRALRPSTPSSAMTPTKIPGSDSRTPLTTPSKTDSSLVPQSPSSAKAKIQQVQPEDKKVVDLPRRKLDFSTNKENLVNQVFVK